MGQKVSPLYQRASSGTAHYDLLPDVEDDKALGEYFGLECGVFDAVPEHLRCYIDYEHYGRDIRMEMDMCFTSYGAVIRN